MNRTIGTSARLKGSIALLSSMVLLLAACGNQPQPSQGGALKGFKLGIALSTNVADHHWSYRMDQDARAVAKELGIEVQLSSAVFDPTQAEPVIRQFVAAGYNLILANSFSQVSALVTVAKENPTRAFGSAAPPASAIPDNVVGYTYSYVQTGYPMCWLGAKLSKKGILGIVATAKVPYNLGTDAGCKKGAEDAVPGIKIVENFSNDFSDQQKGREVAQSVVAQGADVLFESGGTDSSLGTFAFCKEQRLTCLGTIADQSELAPDSVVASTVLDWKPWLTNEIKQVAAGNFKGGRYTATFQNGGMNVVAFKAPSASKVPQQVRDDFFKMIDALKAGKIALPPD